MKTSIENLGGWHPDSGERSKYAIQWPIGSIFANEGRRLYDLVIEKKPELVVEVGGYHGCSGSWIAMALIQNKRGRLISIDNGQLNGRWSLVPDELKSVVEFVNQDCFVYEPPENIDILFEDGMHTYGFTKAVLERYKAKTVVCHDYMHWDCGATVKHDFDAVFGKPDEIFFEKPSDCGLAIKYIL